MQPFTTLRSRVAVLPIEDIDTDQIIPARFLKSIDKDGLGSGLFADWRYLPDGSANPEFPLNSPESRGAQILLAGNNFGCGSSREHAPWALLAQGFRALVSTSFADIFYNNALKNGMLPVVVGEADHRALVELYRASPAAEMTIDLEAQTINLPDRRRIGFAIDGFARICLLKGLDELGYLLSLEKRISQFERSLARDG